MFDFINPSLLTNPINMELIHVEESLKIFMKENEIVSKKRSEKIRFERFEILSNSQSENDKTLNM